jgi:uncharacterized Fe-S center protein
MAIKNVSGACYNTRMKTKTNLETIEQLINQIYEDNFSHIDFMDNMGGDCDCLIHSTLYLICDYAGIEVDE